VKLDSVRAGTLALSCLALLAACDRSEPVDSSTATAPRPAVQFGELEVDGQRRTYRVFAPPTIEVGTPAPLVLALHDAFGSAQSFREATQFDRAAAAGNFVVVYPESLVGTWNGGFCCGRAMEEGIDDVAFLTRMLDELTSTYVIDPARIYAVGASNGAIMAYRLGCELANRVAGVASVGGAMVMDGCLPDQPVSVLAIHGTEDGHVPYEGGPTSGAPSPVQSQPQLLARWAELNGCAEGAVTETEGLVTTSTWKDCQAERSVRLLTVEGGGHTWFSSEFGQAAGAVDATGVITEFFDLAPQ
jgi:polyhydroxybutyrate depolymerase